MSKILTKLPDEVLMFNALVKNNDINLIKRYLDEEVIVGSDLDKELNKVFKTVGLTTDNLQGVGTTSDLNDLLRCYYNGRLMNNFSERLNKVFSNNYSKSQKLLVELINKLNLAKSEIDSLGHIFNKSLTEDIDKLWIQLKNSYEFGN